MERTAGGTGSLALPSHVNCAATYLYLVLNGYVPDHIVRRGRNLCAILVFVV